MILSECWGAQDFVSRDPNQFDSYIAPIDWKPEQRARAPAHIETRRIYSQNIPRQFAAVYGAGQLGERMKAVAELRALHVREPHKYTITSIRNARRTLTHRWMQEIKKIANAPMLHARVERPTYAQSKSDGMTIGPIANKTLYMIPDVFSVMNASGYFQNGDCQKMNAEKEFPDRRHYHNTPDGEGGPNTRTGAAPEPVGLAGPPTTQAESRMAAPLPPIDKNGRKICRNFNSHLGCSSKERVHSRVFYKNTDQLS